MKLGIGTYAIHRGDQAIVYDTFASMAQAKFVRDHLENMGIRKFTVVYSHWHLDHIAGDAVYGDSDAIATSLTRDALAKQRTAIESGTLWGPPAIAPVRIPGVAFDDFLPVSLGDIELELHRMNIHSIDGCVIWIPKDRILLAGDTLEDPLTYMVEVENLADHLKDLERMRQWDIAKIFPNHGDPDVIGGGGYDKTLIDATVAYVTKMLAKSHDRDYLTGDDGGLHRRVGGEGVGSSLCALPRRARPESQACPRLLAGEAVARVGAKAVHAAELELEPNSVTDRRRPGRPCRPSPCQAP